MGIPFPSFNIPLVSNLISLYNNVIESKQFIVVKESVFRLSKPYIVFLALYINYMKNYFLTVPEKLTKDLYYIRYFHEGKFYRLVFPIKRYNETNIVRITSDLKDIDDINEFLGPNNDFNGVKITPNDIGLKGVTITYFKDDNLETITKTFTEDETIILN